MNGLSLTRILWPGLALILGLLVAGIVLKWMGIGDLLDETWIDQSVRGQGVAGELLFLGVGAAAMALGFPRQVIGFLGGYAFGLAFGGTLALAATVLACVFSYTVANLAMHLIGWRPGDGRLIGFLRQHPFSSTLLIRLLPAGNNLATCLAAGGARIPLLPFAAGSGLGYIPQTLIFALLGSGLQVAPVWRVGTAVALFLASGVLGLHLYRRYRSRLQGAVPDPEAGDTAGSLGG